MKNGLPIEFEVFAVVAFEQIPAFVFLAQRSRHLRKNANDLLQRDYFEAAWSCVIVV